MGSGDFPDFNNENARFEHWLRKSCRRKHYRFDEKGLEKKYEKMGDDPFPFLRGTYFRWATTIEQICPELKDSHEVLAVGDIHIENFGTWRNADQRLVWGINDFDEAAHMPYTFDLVRLVTSARLATDKDKLQRKTIARKILIGYRLGLKCPRATLLDQQQTWMNDYLRTTDGERLEFQDDMDELREQGLKEKDIPPAGRKGLIEAMPKGTKPDFGQRRAGVVSLGRPRYVAIAEWLDGIAVREAKMQLPSAWDWAHGHPRAKSRLMEAAHGPSRSPDPYLAADGNFVIRRLAADADKIGVDQLDPAALQSNLFGAMGFDLGAFHGGKRADAHSIEKDLSRLHSSDDEWLHHAAGTAQKQVEKDYDDFKAWIEKQENKK